MKQLNNQINSLKKQAEQAETYRSISDEITKLEGIVLFLKLQDDHKLTEHLKEKVVNQIRTNLTPRHVPAKVVAVPDIPRTRSGKITELAVRDIVHGKEIKNKEALANPEALIHFANIPDLSQG